eukprot:4686418-Pyramimonas_sp.AAC.1
MSQWPPPGHFFDPRVESVPLPVEAKRAAHTTRPHIHPKTATGRPKETHGRSTSINNPRP